jgi:hypothetical protein
VFFLPLLSVQDFLDAIELVSNEPKSYKSVVLDTGSMFQDLVIMELMGFEEIPEQKSWGLISQQQYGQIATQMKRYLRSYLDLASKHDKNVIVICQERNFNEGTDSEVLQPSIGSALLPSVTGWLHPACNYVGQTFIRSKIEEKTVKIAGKEVKQKVRSDTKEFCLRTGVHDIYATKFRLPRGKELPDVIVNPTADKIFKLIKG